MVVAAVVGASMVAGAILVAAGVVAAPAWGVVMEVVAPWPENEWWALPQPAATAATTAAAPMRARCRRYHRPPRPDHNLTTMAKPTSPTSLPGITTLLLGIAVLVTGCGVSGHRQAPETTPRTSPPTIRLAEPEGTTTTSTMVVTAVPTTTSGLATATAVPTTTKSAPASTTGVSDPHSPVTASNCGPNVAGRLASTGQSSQLVVVDAPSYSSTSATVTLWQRRGSCWVLGGGPWAAEIGANGFSDRHREGDQSTPTGAYRIGRVMYGNAPNPGVRYAYHQLGCGDWWDEDPVSGTYNTFQHVACGQPPSFGGDSEALWQEASPYPVFAVVDYNSSPAVEGAGSGIFIHADNGTPTDGCVSLPLAELDAALRWLDPAASPLVVMGPDSEISRF